MTEGQGERTQHKSRKNLAEEFHELTLQVAKLSTWVSSVAALSIVFIGFIAWTLQGAMEDLSSAVRGMTELQRDIHYLQNQQDRLRNRMDGFENQFHFPGDAERSEGGN